MTDKAKFSVEIVAPKHLKPVYSKGYTLKEAAEACGCSAVQLRRVLLKERRPSDALRRKLANLPQRPLNVYHR